jgi:protein gp37
MADTTLIAWTDHTANFWMGCMKVSEGCRNCYAETLTTNRMGLKVWGPPKTTARQAVTGVYRNLRAWNRDAGRGVPGVRGVGRHLVFVGSLMDWAEEHPSLDEIRERMWEQIRIQTHLEFQLLTKRPERIASLLPDDWDDVKDRVWLGTSIESMDVAERADHLRGLDAAVRFISYEPALGPLDELDLDGIDWVIFGGESGPGYRKADVAWAHAMKTRCDAAGVTFFFKQSSAPRTEMGIDAMGEVIRPFPLPRGYAAKRT